MPDSLRMSSLHEVIKIKSVFEEEYIDIPTGVISIGQDSISYLVQDTMNQDKVEEPPIQEIIPEEQPRAPLESMSLRRSPREKRNAISDDYIVFLQEHEKDIGVMEDDLSASIKPLKVLTLKSGFML